MKDQWAHGFDKTLLQTALLSSGLTAEETGPGPGGPPRTGGPTAKAALGARLHERACRMERPLS